jgi:CheY-like chemotaxis protein
MLVAEHKTILLVEDDEDDAELFQLAIDRSQCAAAVERVRSAEEAIARIKAGGHPQLVFLDLLLPNLGGVHFLRWIRERKDCQCIPVVVITGLIRTQTMADLCALGVNAVMIKPSGVTALQEAIFAACTFWLKYCVPPRGVG